MRYLKYPIDVRIKEKEDFENEDLFEMYVDDDWHKVMIHNLAILSQQIQYLKNILIEIETKRINDQLMRQVGGAGKIKVVS